VAGEFLHSFDGETVFGGGEGEGAAFLAGAAGAADAVDVVLGMVGHVEIEDVAEAADVQSPRGDVAAAEQTDLAGLEFSSVAKRTGWDMSPCRAPTLKEWRVSDL